MGQIGPPRCRIHPLIRSRISDRQKTKTDHRFPDKSWQLLMFPASFLLRSRGDILGESSQATLPISARPIFFGTFLNQMIGAVSLQCKFVKPKAIGHF